MIEIGRPAPQFSLPDQDGTQVTLRELTGRPVVVYFYPADDTAGCTTQACSIRDQWSEFEDADAVVLGISPDDVASHARFATKYDLPHRLLADPERTVIEAYGAWGRKVRRGKEFDGVIRSTVLVGPDGTVSAVWPEVDPKTHADEVLAAIRGSTAS